MKLVTGIEAIQSGKPFRPSGSNGRWIQPDDGLGSINAADLHKKGFIIKEEPREFWINIDGAHWTVYGADYFVKTIQTDKGEWIRVREVEK